MGAMRPNYKCWARGKSVKNGEWVYGNYVQMLIDSVERPHIYPFPMHANSGNHAYTPDPVEIERDSVQRSVNLTDYNGVSLFEDDIVEIPSGQFGVVCYEIGTWGVGITDYDGINYERLEKIVEKTRYGNSPHFIYNDNFISFFELIDNFCSEDACDSRCSAVCIATGKDSSLKEYCDYYIEADTDDEEKRCQLLEFWRRKNECLSEE